MRKAPKTYHLKNLILLIALLSFSLCTKAQVTTIKGKVLDGNNGEPLIAATVNFTGTNVGVNTDLNGQFRLKAETTSDSITVSYLGYVSKTLPIKKGQKQTLEISLENESINLQQVEVVYDGKYRNKNNPAVELIKRTIEQKKKNRVQNIDFYELEKYEKVMLGLSNVTEKFKKRKIFRKLQFLFENMDTTSIPGIEILPIYLKESISDIYYRQQPEKEKEFILADTTVAFEGYVDNQGFSHYIDNLYQKVDIFENNVLILNQQFLSPIANGAPAFYKYFIQDTVLVEGTECIELFFAPKNKLDVLFQGTLYIAYKDNHNIKKVDMSINPKINLNFVKSLSLKQAFQKINGEQYFQITDEFSVNFGVFNKGMGIFGKRLRSNRDILLHKEQADRIYKGNAVVADLGEVIQIDSFWKERRHIELADYESITYQKIDSLKNTKVFKRAMGIATLVLSGYTNLGPNYEIGPVNTFYSFSTLEGLRLRVGGRTTPKLSTNFEIENYLAYGFKDKQYKGYLGLSFAAFGGNLHQFPVRRIRVSGQRETQIPGQQLQFVQEDNLLLSFKRGVNDKYLYNTDYRFEFRNEFENRLTLAFGYRNWLQTPAGNLKYERLNRLGELEPVADLRASQFSLLLRWAPHEKFYQGKTYRIPITNKYPIISLWYIQGLKDFAGGDYNYSTIFLRLFKRFYLSQFGYSDMYFESGVTLGQVPYPLLKVHPGNQTYSFQTEGYNMMNFLEFVSDRYASVIVDHNFNGFFFNRIPLIKKLKLRESINFRMLYGGLRSENDPTKNVGLIFFPETEGVVSTFTLEEKPYIEGSFGISNIFKVFRVDLVKRFTYLENPNISEWGIRARFRIYF